jgi:hypothetical protein
MRPCSPYLSIFGKNRRRELHRLHQKFSHRGHRPARTSVLHARTRRPVSHGFKEEELPKLRTLLEKAQSFAGIGYVTALHLYEN